MAISVDHLRLPPGRSLDLMIIGQSRRGKSATGNSILRREEFRSQGGWDSVTKVWNSGSSNIDGRVVRVVDTPGFGDTDSNSEQEDNENVIDAITGSIIQVPEGFNALLLTVSFKHPLDWKDRNLIKSWMEILGEESFKTRGIVVMTHGDHFKEVYEDTMTIQEWWSRRKDKDRWIWEMCGRRCVMFQNNTKDYTVSRKQLYDLVYLVDELNSGNKKYIPVFYPIPGRVDPVLAEKARKLTVKVVHFKQLFCLLNNTVRELESSPEHGKQKIFAKLREDAEIIMDQLKLEGNSEIYDFVGDKFGNFIKRLDLIKELKQFPEMRKGRFNLFERLEKIQTKLEKLVENSLYWQVVKSNVLAILQIAGYVVTLPAWGPMYLATETASWVSDKIKSFRAKRKASVDDAQELCTIVSSSEETEVKKLL